jgi:hypothetical protein
LLVDKLVDVQDVCDLVERVHHVNRRAQFVGAQGCTAAERRGHPVEEVRLVLQRRQQERKTECDSCEPFHAKTVRW